MDRLDSEIAKKASPEQLETLRAERARKEEAFLLKREGSGLQLGKGKKKSHA